MEITSFALSIAFSLILLADGDTDMQNPADQQPSEDDWWLPDWVKPLPDVIGFYGPNPDDVPDQTLKLVTFRWIDVNPAEGVYDWSILEKGLSQPHNIYIRMENSDVLHCPKWLSEKYQELDALKMTGKSYKDNFGTESKGEHYPLWHPGFKAEFRKLLASFRDKGFGSHPHFKFAYIPGAWAWGEFGLSFVDEMIQQGITPEDYLEWFRETIDAYVDAFGDENAHKLMYTGHDYLPLADSNEEWRNAIGRKLFEYAMKRGCSTRFGLLEKFDFLTGDMPNYGMPAVTIGDGMYIVADDDAGLLADPNCIIGAENEEMGNGNIPWSNYYQLKMTALKSLQIRVNCVFMNRRIWADAPEIHHYMLKSLGRHYYDSPDAWCTLREGRDVYQNWSRWHLGFRDEWWLRNYERWLYQREVKPDGYTVRTYHIETPVKFNEEKYEARRTDHKNGSDYIYFNVDDRFIMGGSNEVQIKVTYLDDNSSKWWIEYDADDGDPYKRSSSIGNLNDGKWKTVTFAINDASFQNRQQTDMDFRIFNGGSHDLTVRFVRVIKTKPRTDR
ncbi:beta-galactosidase [Candidatus Poribacteria bacterium]